MATDKTDKDTAIELVCAKNVHCSFWLPENETHGRLRVTYAVSSNFEDAALPVALFCGPMFGGRYAILILEHLAKTHGVRILFPDRPGMGGSTQVPLQQRIPVWLELVPALLNHVGVERISLICHSAGTLYLLNALHHFRDLLDPEAPYAALMGPWVHNEHSKVALMNLASRLPDGMIGGLNGLVKFIGTRVGPSLAWSGGAISSAAGLFKGSPADEEADEGDLAKLVGTSREVAAEMQRLQSRYFFLEDTTAANEEARLCLKKGGEGLWGVCESYEEYVGKIVAKEQERMKEAPDRPRLKIRVFYAESDMLIGNGGKDYFERCWAQAGVEECIDYKGTVRPGTNHETVFVSADKGGLKTIFEDIGGKAEGEEDVAE